MKCSVCGAEMMNTIGGCWECPTCGNGIHDGVFRLVQEQTPSGCTTSNKVLDSIFELPKGDVPSRGATGWICPKCGRALSPWTSVCPCYWDNATPTCEVKK